MKIVRTLFRMVVCTYKERVMARFEMRCSEEEKERWTGAAGGRGQKLAEWLRELANREVAAERLAEELEAVIPELSKEELEASNAMGRAFCRREAVFEDVAEGLPEEAPVKRMRKGELCDRCKRVGRAACMECRKANGLRG